MLKWFRKYNKIILAVGCVVLMVAFLIPQAVSMFSPKPQDRVAGIVAGQEVTEGEFNQAAFEVELLRSLFRRAGVAGEWFVPYDREPWLLIQRDAQRLGLDASAGEVNAALQTLGLDEAGLAELAQETKRPADDFRYVMRRWLVSERYRMLVMGRRYDSNLSLAESPGLTTISLLPTIAGSIQAQGANVSPQDVMRIYQNMHIGSGRVSPAASAHFARNALERVGGRVAVLRPEPDASAEIDGQQLERLFREYREFFPGQGAPYPLGYRQPARVRAESLVFSAQDALDAVTVEPLDVIEFYRENRDQFAEDGAEAPEMPTDEARSMIENELRQRKAAELMQRAVAEARALLDEDVRAFPNDGTGYKDLPADFAPLPLDQVAAAVAEQTDLFPTVDRTDGWVSLDELRAATQGLGAAVLPSARIPLANYLSFARELQADGAGTQPAFVQVGVAGETAVDPNTGTVYLVRLTGAESARTPDSLNEVREQVLADAQRVQAYERLAEQADALAEAAVAEGLTALAEQYGTTPTDLPPLPRRVDGAPSADGRSPAPPVPGVGRSAALMDAVFDVVADAPPDVPLIDALTAAQRTVAVPVDRALAVAVFEATSYEAPTRAAYEQRRIETAAMLNDLALWNGASPALPLTEDALSERLGFEPRNRGDRDDEPAEAQADDAETDPDEAAASAS